MENLRDQTLDRMILERIIEQKARDTGIRIDDNMLNGAIEQIATNNGLTVPQLEKEIGRRRYFRSELQERDPQRTNYSASS